MGHETCETCRLFESDPPTIRGLWRSTTPSAFPSRPKNLSSASWTTESPCTCGLPGPSKTRYSRARSGTLMLTNPTIVLALPPTILRTFSGACHSPTATNLSTDCRRICWNGKHQIAHMSGSAMATTPSSNQKRSAATTRINYERSSPSTDQ